MRHWIFRKCYCYLLLTFLTTSASAQIDKIQDVQLSMACDSAGIVASTIIKIDPLQPGGDLFIIDYGDGSKIDTLGLYNYDSRSGGIVFKHRYSAPGRYFVRYVAAVHGLNLGIH